MTNHPNRSTVPADLLYHALQTACFQARGSSGSRDDDAWIRGVLEIAAAELAGARYNRRHDSNVNVSGTMDESGNVRVEIMETQRGDYNAISRDIRHEARSILDRACAAARV